MSTTKVVEDVKPRHLRRLLWYKLIRTLKTRSIRHHLRRSGILCVITSRNHGETGKNFAHIEQ